VAAFCVHSVESDESARGEKEFVIYRVGMVNLILLTELQEESYQFLR